MKGKIQLIGLLVLCLSLESYAQLSEALMFSEKNHDFGKIKEADGPVIHEFSFINNGSDTVQITNVKASCGCTTPAWTKEPVAPGQSGIIQAQYNPKNRPGSFNKSLTVILNSSADLLRLFIRGYVEPKPKTLEDEFPTAMGGVRMKYRAFNFGRILVRDEPVVREFDIVNITDSMIIFSDSIAKPDHIQVEFDPQLLKAKERGKLKITYDAMALDELGFRNDNVTLYTSEAGQDAIKSISVYATLQEYFPPMTEEEWASAPKLEIKEAMKDLGKIKMDKSVSAEFVLTNTGRTPLEIRLLKPNCSCVTAESESMTIAPNSSIPLKVTLNPQGRKGNQQKSVAIFSNDPKASAQRITIKAYIETGAKL